MSDRERNYIEVLAHLERARTIINILFCELISKQRKIGHENHNDLHIVCAALRFIFQTR